MPLPSASHAQGPLEELHLPGYPSPTPSIVLFKRLKKWSTVKLILVSWISEVSLHQDICVALVWLFLDQPLALLPCISLLSAFRATPAQAYPSLSQVQEEHEIPVIFILGLRLEEGSLRCRKRAEIARKSCGNCEEKREKSLMS